MSLPKPLSDQVLDAFVKAAHDKGGALDDAERATILRRFGFNTDTERVTPAQTVETPGWRGTTLITLPR